VDEDYEPTSEFPESVPFSILKKRNFASREEAEAHFNKLDKASPSILLNLDLVTYDEFGLEIDDETKTLEYNDAAANAGF